MRFSIVVPVYNNPNDLQNCLTSIDALRFPREAYEIIVVDNNSSDSTPEIARRHSVDVLVERDFQSSYAARNRGIKAAKGEFIAFTDSDCIVDPDWLTHIDAAVEEGVGCLAGEILSAPPATLVERFSDEIGLLRQRGPLSGWHFKPYAQTANAVYRKAVFDQIGLFDPSMQSGGDAAIAWRMQDRTSYTLKFVPEAVVYHHHRASVSELWKQFRRYGTGKMSWALAQPDYTPPAIAKLEADTVAAFDKALEALEKAKIDEKKLLFPVLRAATQMAHFSGYLQDLLATVAQGLTLDKVPQRARELAPRCNICGSTIFVPGPRNRMVGKRAPQCAECGSLERHRALSHFLKNWITDSSKQMSALSLGEKLPRGITDRFSFIREIECLNPVPEGHDLVIIADMNSYFRNRTMAQALEDATQYIRQDGHLLIFFSESVRNLLPTSYRDGSFGNRMREYVQSFFDRAVISLEHSIDPALGVEFLVLVGRARSEQ